jgi:uncharacterized lipoprotein
MKKSLKVIAAYSLLMLSAACSSDKEEIDNKRGLLCNGSA